MPVVVVNGDSDFDRKFATANGKACFVDFTASWCGPCQFIAPIFSELANQYKGSVFLKVDVDECRGTAATYGVNAMPTFIAFVNGQKKATIQGADESGLRSMVSKYASTSAAWSGTGQRLSSSTATTAGPAPSAAPPPPPRSSGGAPAGPNPLEPLLRIADTVNQRLNAFGVPNLDMGGFQMQPFHMVLGIVLLFFFGPFGALIALAICFFTQQRGPAPGAGGPGGRGGASGGGRTGQPPANPGPRAFGGSGQRLGGN